MSYLEITETFSNSNFEKVYALFGVNLFHPKSGCVKYWTFRMSAASLRVHNVNNLYLQCSEEYTV